MYFTESMATALTLSRSDEIVVRGSTAMAIVFQMTNRVPNFIEQSHLETTEGMQNYLYSACISTHNLQHGQPTGRLF